MSTKFDFVHKNCAKLFHVWSIYTTLHIHDALRQENVQSATGVGWHHWTRKWNFHRVLSEWDDGRAFCVIVAIVQIPMTFFFLLIFCCYCFHLHCVCFIKQCYWVRLRFQFASYFPPLPFVVSFHHNTYTSIFIFHFDFCYIKSRISLSLSPSNPLQLLHL